jgi:hypothetical protein
VVIHQSVLQSMPVHLQSACSPPSWVHDPESGLYYSHDGKCWYDAQSKKVLCKGDWCDPSDLMVVASVGDLSQ